MMILHRDNGTKSRRINKACSSRGIRDAIFKTPTDIPGIFQYPPSFNAGRNNGTIGDNGNVCSPAHPVSLARCKDIIRIIKDLAVFLWYGRHLGPAHPDKMISGLRGDVADNPVSLVGITGNKAEKRK